MCPGYAEVLLLVVLIGTLTKNEMTVRAVVTTSGRFNFTGTGYTPEGEVQVRDGEPLSGLLRDELERALTVADRANNAVLQKHNAHHFQSPES